MGALLSRPGPDTPFQIKRVILPRRCKSAIAEKPLKMYNLDSSGFKRGCFLFETRVRLHKSKRKKRIIPWAILHSLLE